MAWNYMYFSIPKLEKLHCSSLGMDMLFHPRLYNGCNYISTLGLKSIHVNEGVPGSHCWGYYLSHSCQDTAIWEFLTHCGLVKPYAIRDLGQHWFRLGLAAWQHQAIPWNNVNSSSIGFWGAHPRPISGSAQEVNLQYGLENYILKWPPHFPGVNELRLTQDIDGYSVPLWACKM